MKTTQLFQLLFSIIIISSCSKTTDADKQAIDVSQQWNIDIVGNLILGTGDAQWQSKNFTSQELSLFSSLDTADLTGTSSPVAVLEHTYNFTYPNPFYISSGHTLHFSFTNGYSGPFVLKLVYVDNRMNPVFKTAVRMQAYAYPPPNASSSNSIVVKPVLSTGSFRLYYTLSSSNDPHFYKSWGNVQGTQ
ncbi:MAG: hypothetical protein ABI741_16560 [Ferruginibacter sp.]